MARIRTIKPEFWRSESMASVSPEACLLAVGLLNCADDEGYFLANPSLLKADVFPLRELSGSIPDLLQQLSRIGYIELFVDSVGKSYGRVVNFLIHQSINKPTPSKIKDLGLIPDDYGSSTVVLPIGRERKGKEKEGKGMESAKPSAIACPPDVHESVWSDWLNLRKAKKAPVTETVLKEAMRESEKANMTFEDFLKEWCVRGSQGLKAEWIKPAEKTRATAHPGFSNKDYSGGRMSLSEQNMEAAREAKRLIFCDQEGVIDHE
jgi:hypothetical protein